MTTFLLIRHGDTDAIGHLLAGWQSGWHLNARGREQCRRLADKLGKSALRAVYTSPLERAVETAEPIAEKHGLTPQKVEDLGEVRIGDWEGKTFVEMENVALWRAFNALRSGVRPPGGELMIECQTRMIRQIACLAERHSDEAIAIVSHGDPLRLVLAYYMGIPLDFVPRFEVSPASLSILQVSSWGFRVLCLNQTEDLPL